MVGRPWQDLELGNRGGALAGRGADAIGSGVAAADDDDVLVLGGDGPVRRGLGLVVAGDPLVLLRQELHRIVDAGEVAAGYVEIARPLGPAGQRDRVVFGEQRLDIDRHTHFYRGAEFDPFGRHLLDAAVDQMLLHLEVGNAIAKQPADAVVLLEQRDGVAGAGELLGARHPGGARPDHGDPFAGAVRRDLRQDPAFRPTAVDDRAFDRFDRDRLLVDVERAGRLARRRADAAG